MPPKPAPALVIDAGPTEKHERARLAALARADAAGFAAEIAVLLADPAAPQASRVAALRVAYEVQGAAALALFHGVLRDPGGDEALRSFAARFLNQRAARDRAAWRFLAEQVCGDPAVPAPIRRDAAQTVCRCATDDDGATLWALAAGTQSPEVAGGVLAGLAASGPAAAGWGDAAGGGGATSATIRAWLAEYHPDPEIRARAAAPEPPDEEGD